MALQESNTDEKINRYAKLREKIFACEKCPKLVYSRKLYAWGKPVPGCCNIDSEIMFIGEAPGRFGAGMTGVPFTKDRSGVLFIKLLDAAGFTQDDVYVTNAVKCCPENNRTPKTNEVKNCFNFMNAEIDVVQPKMIVLMGKTAFEAFRLNYPEFKDKRAFDYFSTAVGTWFRVNHTFYVTYHPAYYLRTGKIPLAIKHFKYLREIYDITVRGGANEKK